MLKPLLITPKILETERETMELNQWVWDSHYWVEINHGYYSCKYCKSGWTSTMPIGNEVALCEENPKLKERRYQAQADMFSNDRMTIDPNTGNVSFKFLSGDKVVVDIENGIISTTQK